jgi:hypothetical protein
MEQHKSDRHVHDKEQASSQQVLVFIQSTVSPHLLRVSCLPDQPLRSWLRNIRQKVGIDERLEREQARDRCHAALKPMRSATTLDTWLAEYDHAVTEAELYGV